MTEINRDEILTNPRFEYRTLYIGQEAVSLAVDTQFPETDPWGIMTRDVLVANAKQGVFDGRSILEGGIGAGGNVIACGKDIKSIQAVEIDPELVPLAEYNLSQVRPNIPRSIVNTDIVDFLIGYNGLFEGTAIFCLPQSIPSEDGENSVTDTYNVIRNHNLGQFHKYGLNLNAAALYNLRQIATEETECFITLNGRIPEIQTYLMFHLTGWVVKDKSVNTVQQDPDTDIGWMRTIQDETHFFDKDGKPIEFSVAYGRLLNSMYEAGGNVEEARKILRNDKEDVRHRLNVYRLKTHDPDNPITPAT